MRAAILETVPGDLVIDEVSLMDIGPDEVLVQTAACGLCHSDLHVMEGKMLMPAPSLLGHEAAGVVRGGRLRRDRVRARRPCRRVSQRALRRVLPVPARPPRSCASGGGR